MHINISSLLDVAIGLIFIFFVFSIFVSGIVELINTLMEQRAKLLRIAIEKILDTNLAAQFFNHLQISVKQLDYWGKKPVSYLSADSFSTVLVDLLVKLAGPVVGNTSQKTTEQTFSAIKQAIEQPNLQKVRELLEPILARSDTFQDFKDELDKWYNGYMEQVSGWFKRYAQGVVWIVAVLVTLVLNVDTVYLTNRLFEDTDLREQLVEQAINTTKTGGNTFRKDTTFGRYLHSQHATLVQPDSAAPNAFVIKKELTGIDSLAVQTTYLKFVHSQISDLKLPIGWDMTDGLSLQKNQKIGLALLGWVLTAAALSFGAPFWFDLLLKLVNIRNAARRPPGNTENNGQ